MSTRVSRRKRVWRPVWALSRDVSSTGCSHRDEWVGYRVSCVLGRRRNTHVGDAFSLPVQADCQPGASERAGGALFHPPEFLSPKPTHTYTLSLPARTPTLPPSSPRPPPAPLLAPRTPQFALQAARPKRWGAAGTCALRAAAEPRWRRWRWTASSVCVLPSAPQRPYELPRGCLECGCFYCGPESECAGRQGGLCGRRFSLRLSTSSPRLSKPRVSLLLLV